MGATSLDYTRATFRGPICRKVPRIALGTTFRLCIFLKVKSEVVMSCYLLSRHLHVCVEPFHMCDFSFGFGICDMYGKLPTGDLGSFYEMQYTKFY